MYIYAQDMQTAFSSPAKAMLRTMMLTLGEFDFDDLFFNSDQDPVMATADNPDPLQPELLYPVASYILWIVFVIVMPIVLINLLV